MKLCLDVSGFFVIVDVLEDGGESLRMLQSGPLKEFLFQSYRQLNFVRKIILIS